MLYYIYLPKTAIANSKNKDDPVSLKTKQTTTKNNQEISEI